VTVANAIIDKVESLKGSRIPDNVEVSITRNYGETANDKVNELIFKLFVATFFVFLLVLVAFRALRPAIVVVLVIPVVLFMTVFIAWIWGIHHRPGESVRAHLLHRHPGRRRHRGGREHLPALAGEGRTDDDTAIDAVREVGNPTILATFTVIAALLPMGFVSGMMGPYMAPIPKLGSVAMFISLFAAFVFTPYLAISKWLRPSMTYLEAAEKREHTPPSGWRLLPPHAHAADRSNPRKRSLFKLVLWGTFLFTCSFFYFNWVAVKMMPLDNKPEFSVVIDLPEGTALPVTANLAQRMAEKLRSMPR
jgi:multidrug efflux pump subunit AcrB